MLKMLFKLAAVAVLASFAADVALARPLVPAEKRYRPFTAGLPACGHRLL